jgi:hypothetical protein
MLAALILAASVSAAPTPARLEAMVAPAAGGPIEVRSIRCQVLGDPTEYRCTWRQKRSGRGAWGTWSTILAQDGETWILIDTPGRASHP